MTIDRAIEALENCTNETDRQIAKWLEELKMYKSMSPRELVSAKQKNDRVMEYTKGFNYGHKIGYNKAIDDMVKMTNSMDFRQGCIQSSLSLYEYLEIKAQQLKAGGENA